MSNAPPSPTSSSSHAPFERTMLSIATPLHSHQDIYHTYPQQALDHHQAQEDQQRLPLLPPPHSLPLPLPLPLPVPQSQPQAQPPPVYHHNHNHNHNHNHQPQPQQYQAEPYVFCQYRPAMPHRIPSPPRASFPSQDTAAVRQALEMARESPDGAQDPTICKILEVAINSIWGKLQGQPESYIMDRDEFAVFNYFQYRFKGDGVAVAARKRYWDHLHG